MIRRLAIGVASVASLLLAVAPIARAESIAEGQPWGGTSVTPPGVLVDPASTQISVQGVLKSNGAPVPRASISVTPTGPAGCPAPEPQAASVGGDVIASERPFSTGPFTFPANLCNGSYQLTVRIQPAGVLVTTATLMRPAPVVSGVKAVAMGRTVRVEWTPVPSSEALDVAGYVVERKVGSGEFTEVGSVSADTDSIKDSELPDEAGTVTYRVKSLRPGGNGSVVMSAASSEAATPFAGVPGSDDGGSTGGDTDGDGTGDGGAADGGIGAPVDGSGGDSSTGAPGSGGRGSAGRSAASSRVQAPRIGNASGSYFPPLGSVSPPTTVDDGFSETLPFEDREPGEQDPVLPDEDLASITYDDASGRGLAIPFATALVLAVWAFHLRYLARVSQDPSG